jgi:hypothetical protein
MPRNREFSPQNVDDQDDDQMINLDHKGSTESDEPQQRGRMWEPNSLLSPEEQEQDRLRHNAEAERRWRETQERERQEADIENREELRLHVYEQQIQNLEEGNFFDHIEISNQQYPSVYEQTRRDYIALWARQNAKEKLTQAEQSDLKDMEVMVEMMEVEMPEDLREEYAQRGWLRGQRTQHLDHKIEEAKKELDDAYELQPVNTEQEEKTQKLKRDARRGDQARVATENLQEQVREAREDFENEFSAQTDEDRRNIAERVYRESEEKRKAEKKWWQFWK